MAVNSRGGELDGSLTSITTSLSDAVVVSTLRVNFVPFPSTPPIPPSLPSLGFVRRKRSAVNGNAAHLKKEFSQSESKNDSSGITTSKSIPYAAWAMLRFEE